jgi:hypothetical protein
MIVRNEAHVVKEVLDSVAPYISSWVIVDTGSDDGTQDLITSHMPGLGILGELHERQSAMNPPPAGAAAPRSDPPAAQRFPPAARSDPPAAGPRRQADYRTDTDRRTPQQDSQTTTTQVETLNIVHISRSSHSGTR